MKKIVETCISSLDSKTNYQSKAILNNNTLKYIEDDYKVTLKYDNNTVILTRKNEVCNYTFTFKKNKSNLVYTLKENDLSFNMDFYTKKISIKDGIIDILYILDDIEYEYKVILKEDL